ncbi:hypothetical protein KSD_36460 [Ktedonobacter sp. SOSP1-85]|uniref:SAM hydrolase/SAM-dependent halogenase family protein n=1 Tax=Ktedonobacter sp. SOSP1-85 TaxID=2778367 RepID=UPI0019160C95|nr:SAM-dependent chlorinase/fluorinase [Ktedonobacter sp. SOSP1-85]GHO75875.1 hypothetical protein KSD_36460 [Ktedonobacter sp. SOSP1-85]
MDISRANDAAPVIALLTDFGVEDGYVGVMKGVMSGIAHGAQFLDLTHHIAPQQVAQGAWLLSTHYRYFPKGTIFLCVVDPGVGSERRAVALHAGEWLFVGPDNGLFTFILAEQILHQAVALTAPAYRLPTVSSTFHGRDIFAPTAAHLARGVALDLLGPRLEASSLRRLDGLLATRQGNEVQASVVHVDHFGNLITSLPMQLIPEFFSAPEAVLEFPELGVRVSERRTTFALSAESQVQQGAFMLADSSGYLLVAIQNGNAAQTLGVKRGARIQLRLRL